MQNFRASVLIIRLHPDLVLWYVSSRTYKDPLWKLAVTTGVVYMAPLMTKDTRITLALFTLDRRRSHVFTEVLSVVALQGVA